MDKSTKTLLIVGGVAAAALLVLVWLQSKAAAASSVVVSSAYSGATAPTWMNTGNGYVQDTGGNWVPESKSWTSAPSAADLATGGLTRLPGASTVAHILNPFSW